MSPRCILGYKWVYLVLVSTPFLYDRYISSFRPVFVSSPNVDRDNCHAMDCVSDVRLAMRSVMLRYKADGISGGR